MKKILYLIALLSIVSTYSYSTIYLVGSNQTYKKPSQVANLVKDGDTVNIQPETWTDDVATWSKSNLLIRGVNGMAILKAGTSNAGGKAIWVIQGSNVRVENVDFSGCKVDDNNGAGIRYEGKKFFAKNCSFHHNEMGILTINDPETEIYFESCEFYENGYGDGYSHNIYIGRCKLFEMKYCYSHQAKIGHCVKSRASENYIMYNRIMDLPDGTSSMLIDLPNGGKSFIIGNEMMEGPLSENRNIIAYGMENDLHAVSFLCVINNTIISKRSVCSFIKGKYDSLNYYVVNNVFAGAGSIFDGISDNSADNYNTADLNATKLVNIDNYDYTPTKDSPFINKSVMISKIDGKSLIPTEEYVHPRSYKDRVNSNNADMGAHEFAEITGIDDNTITEISKISNIKIYNYFGDLIATPNDYYTLKLLSNQLENGLYIVTYYEDSNFKSIKLLK